MAGAKDGDKVKVHYTGKLEDGTVFDTSRERNPLEFSIGKGQLIPGFEEAVIGMETGASQTVVIPPEKAYGSRREEMIMCVGRDQFPDDSGLEVGVQVQSTQADGQVMIARVTAIDEDEVTLDANHPLADKELTFEIEIVSIEEG
jgi:peptidylprolyl isomerase